MAGNPVKRARREAALKRDPSGMAPDDLPTPERSEPEEYHSGLDREIVELGKCGVSLAQIATHWLVSLDDIEEWASAHETFRKALGRARTASQGWWEARAHIAMQMDNNRFPAAAWAQVMRARFPEYRERIEQVRTGDLLSKLVILDLRAPADEPEGEP